MAEQGRGPHEVGKDLTHYPFKLDKWLSGGDYAAGWCTVFVAWAYKAAGEPFSGGMEGGWLLKGSSQIKQWFKQHKTWVEPGTAAWSSFTPQPGDYVRINGHSAIVRHISGTTLHTVDGNYSNKVGLGKISNWKTTWKMVGIGHLGKCSGCVTDAHCDDSDPCTTDTCVDNSCKHAPIPGCGSKPDATIVADTGASGSDLMQHRTDLGHGASDLVPGGADGQGTEPRINRSGAGGLKGGCATASGHSSDLLFSLLMLLALIFFYRTLTR
jgi:hypothetical protein